MPGIRDLTNLKEPTVPHQFGVTPPPRAPEPPAVLPASARDAIKRIQDRHESGPLAAQREQRLERQEATPDAHRPERVTRVAIPDDFEAGLKVLEGSIAMLYEQARTLMDAAVMAQGQVEALRRRAEVDAGKLAKVNAALEALKD